jgi:hypothetical protein
MEQATPNFWAAAAAATAERKAANALYSGLL